MTVASVFGAEPRELWLSLDGTARRHPRSGLPLAGGALFEIEAELQQAAIAAMAGYRAELDLLGRNGVTAATHPRLVSAVTRVHPRHDHFYVEQLRRAFPEDVVDLDRAAADAARILGADRLRAANDALARPLLRHGVLDPDQINRALEPFALHTFLKDEGVRVWLPSAAEDARRGEDFFDTIERWRGDLGAVPPGVGAGALDHPPGQGLRGTVRRGARPEGGPPRPGRAPAARPGNGRRPTA
ncbi:hypothetical protein EV190_11416 [Actinorugispora endophytica]|uniref:Uncharacterized protein n=2 Tax=Actinorugispora endophytica TaxID=1605990 RepID=A0A4R6USB8_9ACTN|nr:hypothetical protein EV190_11416 [Actinorugispora endophytica]